MSMTDSAAARAFWPANGLGALVDFAVASHRRAAALLILVSLLAFLPGFFQIPPVDRDEAYFAQATKQMVETGNYVDIRYQGDVRYRKPIGIYWLQSGVVKGGAGARRVCRAREDLALPHTVAARRARRGAGDILVRARVYRPPRRGLGRADDGGSILLGVEARTCQNRRGFAFHRVVAMGALARAYMVPRPGGAECITARLAL